jgi:hypothetical protein
MKAKATTNKKRCTTCQQVKALTEFGKKGTGLQSRCRQCRSARGWTDRAEGVVYGAKAKR